MAGLAPKAFSARGGLLFAGVNGLPKGIADTDWNNIAPRIGVAWSLSPSTVIRGGFGLFYGGTTNLSEVSHGFSATTPWVTSIDGIAVTDRLSNPFPNGILPPPGASDGLRTLLGQSLSFVDTGRRQPFTRQFQAGVQRQLPGQVLVEGVYSGSRGADLPVNQQINATPESFRREARESLLSTGRNPLSDTVPNPFLGLITVGDLSGRTVSRGQLLRGQLLRPRPQFVGSSESRKSAVRSAVPITIPSSSRSRGAWPMGSASWLATPCRRICRALAF